MPVFPSKAKAVAPVPAFIVRCLIGSSPESLVLPSSVLTTSPVLNS
ncbi:TPA: hypothetical protein R4L32_000063 [Campylobacter jejuni]|nr:hypothetical protein [Campylobacter jejuni]MBC2809430.1 hypothetical protein [Campylobacter jejuni]MBC2825217.1 hypothetical protein [Campylobacter jejuni]MBC2880787.1 hypothetical protein [Campylobacter jejuni]MCD4854594.1 hypothetical protein [Campylobacter jejuni]MCH3815720.1 hypothetical protein [Campylobacter jejuni]